MTFSDNAVRIDMLRFTGDRFETFSAMTHARSQTPAPAGI
jgi:hypothetical protein